MYQVKVDPPASPSYDDDTWRPYFLCHALVTRSVARPTWHFSSGALSARLKNTKSHCDVDEGVIY